MKLQWNNNEFFGDIFMYKSLEYLLKKYPFFLDKKEESNFTKTKKVFNNRLQDINNDLFKVYLAGKLEKHLLIWKVQEQPHYFDIYFHVSFDYIKSVEIIRNYIKISSQEIKLDDGTTKIVEFKEEVDEVIYTETFEYEDEINKFEYLYEGYSQTIIPEDKYKINVKTYEEYSLTKGFPENNQRYGDEYDHDYSLDAFGILYNIPRKQYITVNESQYSKTEPPYNNQTTEDDYHYLKRILYYIEHLHDTPLPVLEIYKLFGIKAKMLNRERLIARMIDIERHMVDGEYNREWIPQRWEHKDQWCNKDDEQLFFLANVNNPSPVQGQKFTFDFKVLDSLAKEIWNTQSYNLINEEIFEDSETPFLIVPYINNNVVPNLILYSDKKWTLNTDDINHENAIFNFKLFKNIEEIEQDLIITKGIYEVGENDIVSEEILITVRGCNTADWYVNPIGGNDKNKGTTKTTAFKTVDKALSNVNGEKNIITLMSGEHSLSKAYQITNDTNIITCPNDDVIIWCETPTFFRVMQDRKLYLQNVTLRHNCGLLYAKDTLFTNNNNVNTSLDVKVHKKYNMVETKISNFIIPEDLIYSDKYTITGKLVTTEDTAIDNEEIDLYIDEELQSTVTTNEKGVFTFNNISFMDTDTHNFQVKHNDHKSNDGKNYCRCESETVSRKVGIMPTTLTANVSNETKLTNVLTEENREIHALIKSFKIKDHNNKIAPGKLQLIENKSILETIDTTNKFNYIPQTTGVHEYTLKYIPDYGYEAKTITLTTTVVKTNVVIRIANGQQYYSLKDTITVKGTIETEDGFALGYGVLKIGFSSQYNIDHHNGIYSKTFTNPGLGLYTCTVSYVENSFFKAATKNYSFTVIEVETLVQDITRSGEHQDVIILDEIPNDLSNYGANDLILVPSGNYKQLLLQDTLDTTELTDDDMILLNDDSNELDVLIIEIDEEED